MEWSPQQETALTRFNEWYKNKAGKVFRLFGFAGTGKTTLAKHFAQDLRVEFAAYTGKAASVMRKNGCEGASTIHSLIYRSRDKDKEKLDKLNADLLVMKSELRENFLNGELDALIKQGADTGGKGTIEEMRAFVWENLPQEKKSEIDTRIDAQISQESKIKKQEGIVKKEANYADTPTFSLNEDSPIIDAQLVVIDECSMVDEKIAKDLMSFGKPILVLGDPAQLPPIGGGGYFTENVKPDAMLEEIHRQSAGSPIIEMATKVRKGETLEVGMYGNCEVLERHAQVDDILDYDQVICGKNQTRKICNTKIRRKLGFDERYPMVGDKVVCLKNNHDVGLLNGVLFEVTEVEKSDERKRVPMKVINEDMEKPLDVRAIEHYFLGKDQELKLDWKLKQNAEEFDFGYVLTCHKSQGSQWKKVFVMDESSVFKDKKDRWLYTAITRASEQLTIAKM